MLVAVFFVYRSLIQKCFVECQSTFSAVPRRTTQSSEPYNKYSWLKLQGPYEFWKVTEIDSVIFQETLKCPKMDILFTIYNIHNLPKIIKYNIECNAFYIFMRF